MIGCYLVRHGESEWNEQRITQGQTPHPRLTALGREQAAAAAALIAADLAARRSPAAGPSAGVVEGVVELVVSSDLRRAAETAQVIADRLGVGVESDPRLREQALGRLEGLGYDETWAAAESHDWTDPTIPVAGGESVAHLTARIAGALENHLSGGLRVLVTHGDAIRAALAHLDGPHCRAPAWIPVPNGAVFRIHSDGSWVRL